MAVTYRLGFMRNDAVVGTDGFPSLGASATFVGNVMTRGFKRRTIALDSDERVTCTNISSLTGTHWERGFLVMDADGSLAARQESLGDAATWQRGFLRSNTAGTYGALIYAISGDPGVATATAQRGFLRTPTGALVLG